MAAFAGFPLAAAVGTIGQFRPLTGAEAIAIGNQAAVDCRNSDPTIVGAACEAMRNVAHEDVHDEFIIKPI